MNPKKYASFQPPAWRPDVPFPHGVGRHCGHLRSNREAIASRAVRTHPEDGVLRNHYASLAASSEHNRCNRVPSDSRTDGSNDGWSCTYAHTLGSGSNKWVSASGNNSANIHNNTEMTMRHKPDGRKHSITADVSRRPDGQYNWARTANGHRSPLHTRQSGDALPQALPHPDTSTAPDRPG